MKERADNIKVVHSLETLLGLLNLKKHFTTIHAASSLPLMVERCLKLYDAIDLLQTIFKLAERKSSRVPWFVRRFLDENRLFPLIFTFRGQDLLEFNH